MCIPLLAAPKFIPLSLSLRFIHRPLKVTIGVTTAQERTKKHTVVSEKKGTFICEIVMERYIYLRNTQKQLKITNCGRNKSF